MTRADLVLVLILLLAGCMGSGAPTTARTDIAPTNASPDPSHAKLPDGRDGSFAAFNETNRTEAGAAGSAHRHDLWGGKERVTILQGNYSMGASVYFDGHTDTTAGLPLSRNALVYEGTGKLEVVLSDPARRVCDGSLCSDDHVPSSAVPPVGGSGLHLWYRDPTSEWKDAGATTWGAAVAISIKDPKETDMPHSSYSLWAFEVRSPSAADAGLSFKARIDIIRSMGEIPLWPGHPAFYADGDARVVLQQHVKQSDTGAVGLVTSLATLNFTPDAFVPAKKLVSYGTRSLFVWLNVTRMDVTDPIHKLHGWVLDFHNATLRVNSTWPGENATSNWTLRVGDDGMDSPYATSSRWAFHGTPVFQDPTGGTCWGSACAQYDAEFDLTVIATDVPIEGASDASA